MAEKTTTIRLGDLKALIERCIEKDVRERAQTSVILKPGNSDPEAAMIFAQEVHEAEPEAKKQVELRYRRLLTALDQNSDVDQALAAFVNRTWS